MSESERYDGLLNRLSVLSGSKGINVKDVIEKNEFLKMRAVEVLKREAERDYNPFETGDCLYPTYTPFEYIKLQKGR